MVQELSIGAVEGEVDQEGGEMEGASRRCHDEVEATELRSGRPRCSRT